MTFLRTFLVAFLAHALLALPAHAQAPEFERQYGGFVGWPWASPDPDPTHPDAAVVWTAGAGQEIERYETWSGERIVDRYFGLAHDPGTLHHVFFTEDLSYGYAVGTDGEAYHLPQGYGPADFGVAQYWRPDTFHLIDHDAFGGRELWESYWYRQASGALAGWVAGEDDLLVFTPDRSSQPLAPVVLPPATPGRTRSFKCVGFVDPDDVGGAFVGAAGSTDGIYATQDGLTWQRASIYRTNPQDPLPDPLWIWDIDFVPGEPLVGFAVGGQVEGSGPGYAFRTVDGGLTWHEVLWCSATPGAVCAGETSGLQPDPACQITPGRVGHVHEDVPFATFYGVKAFSDGSAVAVAYGAGIWRYEPGPPGHFVNESDTIRFSTGPLWGVHGYEAPNGTKRLWVSGQFGALRKSEDGGRTWRDVGNSAAWRLKDVAFADDDRGWIAGQDMRVLTTADGGETWTEQTAMVTGPYNGLYLHSIAACDEGLSAGSSAVAVGGAPGTDVNGQGDPATILWTDRGGSACSWAPIRWDAATIANAGHLFADPGEERKLRLNAVEFAGVDAGGQPHYWVVGDKFKPDATPQESLLLHSADGGRTWRRVTTLPDWFSGRGLQCLDLDHIFVVGTQAQFGPAKAFRTSDARSADPTWTDISPVSNPLRPIPRLNDVVLRSMNDAFAVGRDGVVLRYDGVRFSPYRPLYSYSAATGRTFYRFTKQRLFQIAWPTGSTSLYVSGAEGVVIKGSPSVNDWRQINSRSGNDLEGMFFRNGTRGWVVGHQGRWGDGSIMAYR